MNPLLKKYQSFLNQELLKDTCKPLENLGINFFHYFRLYKDQTRIHFCSHPEWINRFYEKEYYKTGSLSGNFNLYEPGHFLWSSFGEQLIFHDAESFLNLHPGVTIIKKDSISNEFFHFGTNINEVNMPSLFFNNIDLLDRFIHFFKYQANNLILDAQKQRIVVPEFTHSIQLKDELLFEQYRKGSFLSKRKTFFKETMVQRSPNIQSLSPRESSCLHLLISGKSALEIANTLFISKRTAEKHIENIKIKWKCSKKSDIFLRLNEFGVNFKTLLEDILI